METTTVETFDYHHYTGGLGVIPVLVILAVLIVPYWKLWSRTGHSGAWALLMLVPLANVISLWVLAFKEWPVLRGRGGN
ncbi:MAG: hypothetical protein U1E34_12020 [Amaricoccus sp.]